MTDRPVNVLPTAAKTPEIAIPVATYARYSTNRQDARSIDDQLRRCHAHAHQRGFAVAADYSDAAASGSHTERGDLQRLLADARRGGIRHLLVDDLSRLSRDLGDAWRLIYGEFASMNVSVIDCTTGMASDGAGARVTFGALALANDTFLQLVRTETHRGLEGRALAGFSTGGKTFGFTTKPEDNPRDPEHPRKISIVERREADIVLRAFSMSSDGKSAHHIANAFNEEGIPAPHDNGKGNKGLRGWSHTTIREMLRNERYIGTWRWNERKWLPVPGKKQRRAVMRPEHEHIVREYPELAIVDRDLWNRVQERLRRFARPNGGRPPGRVKSGNPTSLLSGPLRCGVCGGSLSIVQRTHKKETSYAFLGCLTYRSRGAAICANGRMISEKKVREAVLALLQEQLSSPELVRVFIASFERRYRELEKDDHGTPELEKQIRDAEQKVRNMTEILSKAGYSESLIAQLRLDEQRVADLKGKLADRASARPKTLPHPKIIEGYLRNVLAVLEGDRDRARQILTRHIEPVIITPMDDGRWRLTGALNLSTVIGDSAREAGRVTDNESSGGPATRLITYPLVSDSNQPRRGIPSGRTPDQRAMTKRGKISTRTGYLNYRNRAMWVPVGEVGSGGLSLGARVGVGMSAGHGLFLVGRDRDVPRQSLQQTLVPARADGPDRPDKVCCGQHHEESKSDDRRVFQSTPDEVRIARSDGLVETDDLLMNLRADPAYEQVVVLGHDPQDHRRAIFDFAVGLRKRRQDDVALLHFATSSGA